MDNVDVPKAAMGKKIITISLFRNGTAFVPNLMSQLSRLHSLPIRIYKTFSTQDGVQIPLKVKQKL